MRVSLLSRMIKPFVSILQRRPSILNEFFMLGRIMKICFPCKKSYVSFVKVFKINLLKAIIYRKGSVSKVNVSKGNELKGKVSKNSVA